MNTTNPSSTPPFQDYIYKNVDTNFEYMITSDIKMVMEALELKEHHINCQKC